MAPQYKRIRSHRRPSPGVEIIIIPGKVVSPEEFFGSEFPPYSIGIDGFVSGPPCASKNRRRRSFNHHEGVDRIATRSACAQVLAAEKMGLSERFTVNGGRRMTVWMKGINQDEVLASFILRHPDLIDRPMLKQLVQLEDLLDMSNGLFPIRKRWHLLRRLVWIFEPYTQARADDSIFTMNAEGQMALLEEMHDRIHKTLFGRGEEKEPDTRCDIITQYDGWAHVREIGQHARYSMAHKGIKAFVSIRDATDGKKHVVIGRLSPDIWWFDYECMAPIFNKLDGCAVASGQYWSGADNALCSPRKDGTKQSDEKILSTVERIARICRRREAHHARR